MSLKIVIYGGGSLGHVVSAVLSSNNDCEVCLLTGHPEKWNNNIRVTDCNGIIYSGHIKEVNLDAKKIIPNSDIILFCIPGFLIENALKNIRPYLNSDTKVGSIVSSTGFFFMAESILHKNTQLFGFQRTPFIARVVDYGKSAKLLGYKAELKLATKNIVDIESFRILIEKLFSTPTSLLSSYLEASLTNSNPILHPCRLYGMWHNWHKGIIYKRHFLFYEEWDDFSSDILIKCDKEFFSLLKCLNIDKSIPTLLDYYDSNNSSTLSEKLRSIQAFKGIRAPMVKTDGGFVPDFNSRYFTEDFPFGLSIIRNLAHKNNIKTPCIDKIYNWYSSLI